jgi:hypothetical protein
MDWIIIAANTIAWNFLHVLKRSNGSSPPLRSNRGVQFLEIRRVRKLNSLLSSELGVLEGG